MHKEHELYLKYFHFGSSCRLPAAFNQHNTNLEMGLLKRPSIFYRPVTQLWFSSGILFSYPGGGVMGSMVTGFVVGLRIWRRKSFRCSLSDLILLTRRGWSSRLTLLPLRAGKEGFLSGPLLAPSWDSEVVCAGVGELRGLSSVGGLLVLFAGSDPSFSTAAMMSS